MTDYNPNKIPCVVDNKSHEWMNTERGIVCVECGTPKDRPADIEIKTPEEIAFMIAETVVKWDGKDIADLANNVISPNVVYLGDSMFEVKS